MTTLGDKGELEAIRRLCGLLAAPPSGTIAGPGDDCAIVSRDHIPSGCDILLTSDPVIEGVHFDPSAPPVRIGHKALGRALSDIAAMGGTPLWVLVNLVAPPSTSMSRLEALYSGISALAARTGTAVVGGDTARGPRLELHVFAIGSVPAGRALRRSGARAGDRLFVTGQLGGSILGHHLDFEPRLEEGRWLLDWASAAMDVTDGLATDLRHICRASGVGALIDAGALPISPDAARMPDGKPGEHHALVDGEDFELLFTIPAKDSGAFQRAWGRQFKTPCTCIGQMTAEPDIVLVRDSGTQPLKLEGYEHFRNS